MREGTPLFESPRAAAAFAKALPTLAIGKTLDYRQVAESTNDLAARAAREDAPHGLVVLAEEQTAGRGRRGRTWLAPPGKALLFSVLVRANGMPAERIGWAALASGCAAVEAVERLARIPVRLKWPNDIVVVSQAPRAKAEIQKSENACPWRKLGGVLCEGVLPKGAGGASRAIVGIGLNVNQTPEELPDPPKASATSLLAETGHPADRRALLAGLLERLEARLDALSGDAAFEALRSDVGARLEAWWRGARLAAISAEGRHEGRFAGLDEFGRLRLENAEGKVVALADAEVVGVA